MHTFLGFLGLILSFTCLLSEEKMLFLLPNLQFVTAEEKKGRWVRGILVQEKLRRKMYLSSITWMLLAFYFILVSKKKKLWKIRMNCRELTRIPNLWEKQKRKKKRKKENNAKEKQSHTQDNIYVVWQFAYVHEVAGISLLSGISSTP